MFKNKRNAMRKLLKRQLMKRKIKYDEIQENEKMTKIEKNWPDCVLTPARLENNVIFLQSNFVNSVSAGSRIYRSCGPYT